MEDDEAATVRTLGEYRVLMAETIERHGGRVVDSPGDNLLAEFASVVDAVQSAVEIQEELAARNEELPIDRRMLFRIGINLGDVIQEGERLFGDGVNIAVRIEALAKGGWTCLSAGAHEQLESKVDLEGKYLSQFGSAGSLSRSLPGHPARGRKRPPRCQLSCVPHGPTRQKLSAGSSQRKGRP